MSEDPVGDDGLSQADRWRYLGLAGFATLVVVIGLGNREGTLPIVLAVWLVAGATGLLVARLRSRAAGRRAADRGTP